MENNNSNSKIQLLNNKPVITETKIDLDNNNFTKRQFGYVARSAEDIKAEVGQLGEYNHMGSIICHAFATKSGNGVYFVTVPFLSQVPENAATLMLEQIKKDMLASYGRNEKGRRQ